MSSDDRSASAHRASDEVLTARSELVIAQTPEAGPLPLKIYTLGRFSLLLNDEPLRPTGKAKKKPLELLQALIALGGRDVPGSRLAEALWPDADADLAAYSLTTTLHRLRTLVGHRAVERQSGCLSLCPSHVWVDAWTFERQLSALEQAHQAQQLEGTLRLTASLVRQYRGAFLEREVDHAWARAARERLQARFVRLLDVVGAAHVRAERYDEALVCLNKAVDVAPLAEGPYRSLMQLHLSEGRHSDVLLTYQRCRRALADGIGCAPSRETETLLRKVQPE